MSPENLDRKKTSVGWAKHERKTKAAERKLVSITAIPITTPEDRQRKLNTASWKDVLGLLNIYTNRNIELHEIYQQIFYPLIERDYIERDISRGYYSAGYKDATTGDGTSHKFRNEYSEKYLKLGAEEGYPQPLVQNTAPIRRLIDQFLFGSIDTKK